MDYTAQQYRSESGRLRWAVLHGPTGVWYFTRRYGRAAAECLAKRMNREAS